jgi:hypothetical protein
MPAMVGSTNVIGNKEDHVYSGVPSLQRSDQKPGIDFSQLSLNQNKDVVMKPVPDNFTTIIPTRKEENDRGGNMMMPPGRRN